MYIIKTTVDGKNYFLSILRGNKSRIVYWNGLSDNGEKFTDKQIALDFAFAETTLKTEIIPV